MQKALENIEELIRTNGSLSAETTTKLLGLLTALKPEMEQLSIIQTEQAKNIAEHIERSAQDALRLQKDQLLLQKNSEGLEDIVRRFEVSHPKLVENVNYIATVLANAGI